MSCHIVEQESIVKLVNTIYSGASSNHYFLKDLINNRVGLKSSEAATRIAHKKELGQLLTDLNYESYNTRYNEEGGTEEFKVRQYAFCFIGKVEFAKSLSHYIYQSCEIRQDSELKWLLDSIQEVEASVYKSIVSSSPAYEAAAWN